MSGFPLRRSLPAAAMLVCLTVPGLANMAPAAGAPTCDPPAAAVDQNYTTSFGVPLHVSAPGLLAGDTGDSLKVQTSWGPVNANPDPSDDTSVFGNATIDYGTSPRSKNQLGGFTYTPDPDPTNPFSGIDSFDYWIIDACDNEDIATAYITVVPTVVDASYSTLTDTPLSVPAATGFLARDRGIDPLSMSFDVTSAHGGTVDDSLMSDGSFVYTPPPDFAGTDTFGYQVYDINNDIVYSATVHLSVIRPTVPDAPTGVTAAAGNGTATVSFAPAAGIAVTSYTVTATPGGSTASGPSSPIRMNGLTNGTPYTFTVHATNFLGDGPESLPSNRITPARAPDAPTAVNAVAGGGQASMTWTAPADDGGVPVTSYTVTAAPGGASTTVGAQTSATVTGLTDGTSYTFTVTATNSGGTSVASLPSNAVTPLRTMSIADLSMTEGSHGTTTMKFAVTVNEPSFTTLTANYVLHGVTATGAKKKKGTTVDFNDRGGIAGTVVFKVSHGHAPTTAFISVKIYADKIVEPDETFTITLSNPSGGTVLLRAQAIGTIVNDD